MMETDVTVQVIEKIEALVRAGNAKENRVLELALGDGKTRLFDTSNLRRVYDDPRPATLEVSSLSAIAEYIRDKIEGVDASQSFVRIVSPSCVELLEAFSGEEKKRTCYMKATLGNDARPFPFGEFLDSEEFIIGVMSLFENTEDRNNVIGFSSGLVSEAKIAKTDTGGTTKTQATRGVVNTAGSKDPGVVILKPFRTFRQVAQPESAFVFRYRAAGDGVELALIEADGGAWKHEAMENIEDFFRQIEGLKIIA